MKRWASLVGGVLVVSGLVWWVLQVTLLEPGDRGEASGYGQFVLAAVGLVIMVAGWLWKIFFTPVSTVNVDELADALAQSMRQQWEAAAVDRMLLQPAPMPVRWRRSERSLAGPIGAATMAGHPPLPGLTRVTASRLRSGTHRTLHSVYGGLPSGRLILAGGPGAGKSSAAVLLLLDALRYREQASTDSDRSMIPVPVMFTLHGWDPQASLLADWITTKLIELPIFSGKYGRSQASALLSAGRIAMFLDGLDEVPEKVRPSVLQALSEQVTGRLVLLSRGDELESAAKSHSLAGAVALELQPLTAKDAADYLLRPLTEPAPAAWTAVAGMVLKEPDSPVGAALTVPLHVGLVRDVYAPTGQVDELLDVQRFPDAQAIIDHLLAQAVGAAYAPRPGLARPQYAPYADRSFRYLARQLKARDTHDFMWWEIPLWIPGYLRIPLTSAAGALVGVVTFTILSVPLWWRQPPLLLFHAIHGLLFGFATGLGVGVAGPRVPARIKVPLRRIVAVRPLTVGIFAGLPFGFALWLTDDTSAGNKANLGINIATGLMLGLVIGLIGELLASIPRRGSKGWIAGFCSRTLKSRPIRLGAIVGGIFGVMFSLLFGFVIAPGKNIFYVIAGGAIFMLFYGGSVGLALAFIDRLTQPNLNDTRVNAPINEWRYERFVGVVYGITVVLLFIGILSGVPFSVGIVVGLQIGITSGILVPQFFAAAVAQFYLSIRNSLPFRLVRFLEDARARHLIRTVGPVYQFRHSLLRDRLAQSMNSGDVGR